MVSLMFNLSPYRPLYDILELFKQIGNSIFNRNKNKIPCGEFQLKAVKPFSIRDALFKEVIESLGEAVLITSNWKNGIGFSILYANPAFLEMTGYRYDEILGKSPKILQGKLTDTELVGHMHTALSQGQPFHGKTINYRKDGSTYLVEWRITPIRDTVGEIACWVSVQRDVTEINQAAMRLRLLAHELNHRVKNTLATVQAIVSATARAARTPSEFQEALTGRLTSLAKTHALLVGDQNIEEKNVISFYDIIQSEMGLYDTGLSKRLQISGIDVNLPDSLAVPVSMAVHELTTNAAKYGALSRPEGWVEVTWTVAEQAGALSLHCKWVEHDGPPVSLPSRQGFGSRLLRRALADQFKVKVDLHFDHDGLRADIEIPFPPSPCASAANTELTLGSGLVASTVQTKP